HHSGRLDEYVRLDALHVALDLDHGVVGAVEPQFHEQLGHEVVVEELTQLFDRLHGPVGMQTDGEGDVPLTHRGTHESFAVECSKRRGGDCSLDRTQTVDTKDLDRIVPCVIIFDERQRRHKRPQTEYFQFR